MSKQNNFFRRALNAFVDARTKQAERYLAQYNLEQSAKKRSTDL